MRKSIVFPGGAELQLSVLVRVVTMKDYDYSEIRQDRLIRKMDVKNASTKETVIDIAGAHHDAETQLDLHEVPSDWRQTRTQQGIFLAFRELSLNLYLQIPSKIARVKPQRPLDLKQSGWITAQVSCEVR